MKRLALFVVALVFAFSTTVMAAEPVAAPAAARSGVSKPESRGGLGPGAGWARDGAGRIGGFERCEVEDGSGAADAREGLGLGSLGRWSPLPW